MTQSMVESKLCGRQPLKKLKVCLSRPYPLKFFKGYLPKMLLGPFLNTLSQIYLHIDIPNIFHDFIQNFCSSIRC